TGARQFVVHVAFENTSYDEVSKVAQLTPRTRVCTLPPLEGPVNSTFLAPALMCACALSPWLKAPVASITTSMPRSAHGRFSGLRSPVTVISLPSTTRLPSFTSTCLSHVPCVVS